MCEFKIIKKNDGSQILEDIVVISYTKDNELLFKDVLGMGESLESALILSINTLNQRCEIVEHPLIHDFIKLIKKFTEKEAIQADIDIFKKKLDEFNKQI
jgi:predicted RNA-binding protein